MPKPVFTGTPAQSRRSSFASAPPYAAKISRCFLSSIHAYAPDHVIAYFYGAVLAFELVCQFTGQKAGAGHAGHLCFHCVLETAFTVLFRETSAQQHCLIFTMVLVVLISAWNLCYVVFRGIFREQQGLFSFLVLADSCFDTQPAPHAVCYIGERHHCSQLHGYLPELKFIMVYV